MEIDQGVITLGQASDLISELALAPVLNVVDLPSPSAIVVSIRFITAKRVSSSIVGATKNNNS